MAIPQLYSQLGSRYKGLVRKLTKGSTLCDILCVDLGSLLYGCLNRVENENHFVLLVVELIQHLITLISCQKEIFIAIDGVPPFAKLKEQALRRLNHVNTYSKINSLMLSPGTEFMYNFQNRLKKQMETYSRKTGLKVVTSVNAEPGEGEHKIMNYIKKNKSYRTVIYGVDADLIVLGLISPCIQISLIRENIKTKNLPLNHKFFEIMNIKQLRSYLLEDYKAKNLKYLFDIVLVLIMFGNDFAGRPEGIFITDFFPILKELNEYHKCNPEKLLVDGETGIINLHNFIQFSKYLYRYDLENYKLQTPNYKDVIQAPLLSLQLQNLSLSREQKMRKMKEHSQELLMKQFDKWRFDNYSKWQNIPKHKVKDVVKDYIECLQWVMAYYVTGESQKHYVYEQDFVPRLADLMNMKDDIVKDGLPDALKIKPIHHLALTLPRSGPSKLLLPLVYQREKIPNLEALSYDTAKQLINRFLELDSQLIPSEQLRNT